MRHKLFIFLVLIQCVTILVLLLHGASSVRSFHPQLSANRQLAKHFMFTDLAIWTEARYTRHPSQTDFFSPFQDFPGAMEHFPS